jgi:hypothetical protein
MGYMERYIYDLMVTRLYYDSLWLEFGTAFGGSLAYYTSSVSAKWFIWKHMFMTLCKPNLGTDIAES